MPRKQSQAAYKRKKRSRAPPRTLKRTFRKLKIREMTKGKDNSVVA